VRLPEPLEQAICASPDEASAYLVAADWLQSRGAPQGELITVMRGLEQEQSPARFLFTKARRDELLREQGEALVGGAHLDTAVWRWGFVSHAQLEVEHLPAFLASPAGQFVRELEVRGPLDELAAALTRSPPRVLNGLALVGGRRAPSIRLSALAELASLRRLAVVGVDADFTGVRAERLSELRIRDVRHPTLTAFLGTVASDTLQRLELSVDAPLELKIDAVPRLRGLRALQLEDDLADDLARWGAKAPIVKQLDHLALCGPMTDPGLDALLVEAARLSRLSRFELAGGHFSSGLKRMAYRQLPAISFLPHRAEWAFW
jgi:uncharacterized protein (TIGR02996 family)